MRRAVFTLCFVALCLSAFSQGWRYRADFARSVHDFCDTIFISWEHGQVFVPVSIDGHNYRFLLDTGAGQSVVFSSSQLASQGSQAGTLLAHDATGATDTVPVVTLPPMTIGNVTLSGCRATVQRTAGPTRFDGLLGFDLVNGGLSMKIDVAQGILIISDRPHQFCREEGQRLRYKLNYHVPYIEVATYGGHRERMLFDTGSRQFFSINKDSYDSWNPSRHDIDDYSEQGRSTGRHSMGHHGTEPEGEVVFLELNNLRLGKYAFSRVHAITTQGGSHIGAALLPFGTVSFCPQHRLMLFQPLAAETQPCPVDNRQMEIAFVPDSQGRPEVGLVWQQGEPYRLGFRQGDVVEMIDGRPVTSLAQFARWGFERGREYTFTVVNRQGQRHEVKWVRVK